MGTEMLSTYHSVACEPRRQDGGWENESVESPVPGEDQHRWGIILAGGDGRRLQHFLKVQYGLESPKQFCALVGTRSMLQHTIDRARLVIPNERIVTVITRHHLTCAAGSLSDRPAGTLIVQPQNRETGPAILLPLLHIYRSDPQARIAVFPSDHFVYKEERFMEYVRAAFDCSDTLPGYVYLLAVPARKPEEGYGWIVPGDPLEDCPGTGLYRVKRFVEKPSAQRASEVRWSDYFWNTFTMVGRASAFVDLARLMMPSVYELTERIVDATGTSHAEEVAEEVYRTLPPVNFSRAVLEQSAEYISMIPVRGVYWSDWGVESRIRSDFEKFRLPHPSRPDLSEVRPHATDENWHCKSEVSQELCPSRPSEIVTDQVLKLS